jgi:hypothetical protein
MILDQSSASEFARLLAERQIRRRLVDYCHGVDRCDAEMVASVYHDDGTDDHGSFVGLGSDFATYVARRLRESYLATQHTTADPAIDFVSDTAADVVTYVRAEHVAQGDDGLTLVTFEGEYRDRFEAREGTWKIASRVVVHSWDSRRPLETAFDPGRFEERLRLG